MKKEVEESVIILNDLVGGNLNPERVWDALRPTFVGEVAPGYAFVCQACGYLVDYWCNCATEADQKLIGFDTMDNAKLAVERLRLIAPQNNP